VFVVLMIAALSTPGAWAAQEPASLEPLGLFARLWEAVVEILSPAPTPTSDEGCAIDPHGGCTPGS
jgi:hypothetical protein